jgi:isopenicillin N synthase-like dioxygenase
MPPNEDKMDEVISLMRLFCYEPSSGVADAHVDIGLITMCVGCGAGLQVWDRSAETAHWIDVEGPVLILGDTLRALFRNQVRAGLHRVVANSSGRSSFVFALRPCLRGTINLAAFGGEGEVSIRDHFYAVKDSKWNINATKDVREQQRLESKRQKCPVGQG